MTDFRIETAGPEHLDAIWEIIKASFNGDNAQYVATGQFGYRRYLRELLAEEQSRPKLLVIANIEGNVAAFADITLHSEGPNFLTRIAVSPQFRGKGLATRLMQQIQNVYDTGDKWELDVLQSNISAQRLYHSLGFKSASTRKWLGRLLPKVETTNDNSKIISVANDRNYERYGFTNTHINGKHILIAGTAVRCRDVETFLDTSFLAQVQLAFPKVDRAFIIVDASDTYVETSITVFEIARSDRMSGTF